MLSRITAIRRNRPMSSGARGAAGGTKGRRATATSWASATLTAGTSQLAGL
jgi:hypothetical protein